MVIPNRVVQEQPRVPAPPRIPDARVALDAQVHVVKCKDMNGQDASGLGDICFSVEALGETRKTETAKQSRAAVFDETLFFSRRLCTEEYLEEAVIRIVGTDINSWISGNTVIGEHVLDLEDVYFKAKRMVSRQWLALTSPARPRDGVQGSAYLRIRPLTSRLTMTVLLTRSGPVSGQATCWCQSKSSAPETRSCRCPWRTRRRTTRRRSSQRRSSFSCATWS